MSDYLGRLAARVVTPQRVLRPRVHTAFESYESFETFAAPEVPVAAPRVRASTPPVMRTEPPPVILSAEEREGPRPEHREVAPPQTIETIREVVRERTHVEVAEAPTPIIIEREAAPEPVNAPPPPRERVETQTLVRERRMLERIERLRVRSERSESVRTEQVSTPIEITIGRIDVRAVVSNAAPPPPRQRERPQLMSLRDYMARRDERRRG
jgi:hypothetical protein